MQLVGNYQTDYIGDGVNNSISIDLNNQIQADNKIHNKMPVGILATPGSTANSSSLNGTVLTLSWSTPLGAGAEESGVSIRLLFDT